MMAEEGKAAVAEETSSPDPRLVSEGAISDEALRKAEEFIEQEEGAANRLVGAWATIVTAIAITMALFHLYASYDIVPTQPLRYTHVAFVLVLSFLLFPFSRLVHVWSGFGTLAYVFRPYQVVRSRKLGLKGNQPDPNRRVPN
jgi:TRAP-type uncharacterized transport system fused permease subunit